MHLAPEGEEDILKLVGSPAGRWRFLDRARSALVRLASRFGNYASFESGPRVTVSLLRSGGVGVALSFLYSPFDEMDLSKRYPALPDATYFPSLLRQLEDVEVEVSREFTGQARVVHRPAEIDGNVTELARRGVGYVILAHLFWRGVATNANAIPFLPDWLYERLFPQPRDPGLTELGRAAVGAMVRER